MNILVIFMNFMLLLPLVRALPTHGKEGNEIIDSHNVLLPRKVVDIYSRTTLKSPKLVQASAKKVPGNQKDSNGVKNKGAPPAYVPNLKRYAELEKAYERDKRSLKTERSNKISYGWALQGYKTAKPQSNLWTQNVYDAALHASGGKFLPSAAVLLDCRARKECSDHAGKVDDAIRAAEFSFRLSCGAFRALAKLERKKGPADNCSGV